MPRLSPYQKVNLVFFPLLRSKLGAFSPHRAAGVLDGARVRPGGDSVRDAVHHAGTALVLWLGLRTFFLTVRPCKPLKVMYVRGGQTCFGGFWGKKSYRDMR
jgi:hypothetical protein